MKKFKFFAAIALMIASTLATATQTIDQGITGQWNAFNTSGQMIFGTNANITVTDTNELFIQIGAFEPQSTKLLRNTSGAADLVLFGYKKVDPTATAVTIPLTSYANGQFFDVGSASASTVATITIGVTDCSTLTYAIDYTATPQTSKLGTFKRNTASGQFSCGEPLDISPNFGAVNPIDFSQYAGQQGTFSHDFELDWNLPANMDGGTGHYVVSYSPVYTTVADGSGWSFPVTLNQYTPKAGVVLNNGDVAPMLGVTISVVDPQTGTGQLDQKLEFTVTVLEVATGRRFVKLFQIPII